jgi:predicted nucleic acid-binding protein
MIVVDSNVVAYLCLPGEYTSAAKSLLQDDPEWVAPALWRSEFRNVLAGEIRRGNLTFDEACAIQAEAEDGLVEASYEVDSLSVLRLVRDSDCSAYDCEFVALAIALGVRLVTMDAKVLRTFPDVAVALSGG